MNRAAFVTSAFVVMATGLASSARAESGYVFVGDINGDGVRDKIASGPQALFGTGGGPFVVTIGSKKGPAKRFVVAFDPLAVSVEKSKEGLRIWSYWHLSAGSGDLCVDTLSDKPTQQCIRIYTGEQGTVGTAIYDLVFAKNRRLEFKKVNDYKVPPNPSGAEWGK